MDVNIEQSWKQALEEEFSRDYFVNLVCKLHEEKEAGITIYPRGSQIFKAFDLTPFDKVKVVILGQDPYIHPGEAMGLSFSVPDGVRMPPSLKNIYKEIETDLGVRMSGRTNLEKWAQQGVLLLNSILTVRDGESGSHSKLGWQEFTDAVIRKISAEGNGVVFMLWGNFARTKNCLIDHSRNLVLEAPHPSPLARGAFFGCRHFSKANAWLAAKGKEPIDWAL